MSEFQKYRRKAIAELRPYVPGETFETAVSVSEEDAKAGSPKAGDMIARNPANHADQWLVAEAYFKENFQVLEGPQHPSTIGGRVPVPADDANVSPEARGQIG